MVTEQEWSDKIRDIITRSPTLTRDQIIKALNAFKRSEVPGKLFVTLTDGRFHFNEHEYRTEVRKMNEMGITTVLIMMGSDQDARFVDELRRRRPDYEYAVQYAKKSRVVGEKTITKGRGKGGKLTAKEWLSQLDLGHSIVLVSESIDSLLSEFPSYVQEIQRQLVDNARASLER